MELKRLQHVLALDAERHFARAARSVHLSQPAFSRSIQSIERELDVVLFDRWRGAVTPTPAGVYLIERAKALIFQASALEHDMGQYKNAELGDIAFGVGPFIAATLLPRLVAKVRRSLPRVALRIEVNNWRQLYERLIAEDIEFFIAEVRDLPSDARIEVTALGRQAGGFYVHSQHPIAKGSWPLAKLWSCGVLSVSLPNDAKADLAKRLARTGQDFAPIALECDDFNLLKKVALSTDSVLAATDIAVKSELESGALVRVTVTDLPEPASRAGIVRLSQRSASPMAAYMIAAIKQGMKSIPSERPKA